jgi:hypothetical protein
MSKSMKILLGATGVLAVAAVVLTMFGLPPNLPLGPLQGMLASDDAFVAVEGDGSFNAASAIDCDPVTGQPIDRATGQQLDPVTGQPVGPAGGGATDPGSGTTGQPIAAPAEEWDGTSRIVAAGAATDASHVPDTWVQAAEATDPATGMPPDPAAGVTDPAATLGSTDPAADPSAGMDPGMGAGAGADAGGFVNPCAQAGGGDGTGGFAGAGEAAAGDAGAPGAGAGVGAGSGGAAAASTAARATTDGANQGNNAEALRAAKDASGVMQKASITVSTTATLLPAAGGVARPAAMRQYRSSVTGASLVMRLDAAAMQQWTGAGRKVQADLVESFITRLGRAYRNSSRSVTILDASGTVLAVGDAGPNAAKPNVKLF